MPNAVTIDNYDVKVHERYATDQQVYDHFYLEDSKYIPSHLEIAGGQATITTKWEELFETHLRFHPFANFAPPPNFALMRNRFFTYVISSQLCWTESDKDEMEDSEEENQNEEELENYRKKIRSKKSNLIPTALFERDKTALLNLFDSIQSLNGLLKEIHGRKLQYQKG